MIIIKTHSCGINNNKNNNSDNNNSNISNNVKTNDINNINFS